MRWTELALLFASLAALGSCATAVPAMSGASITPKNRTDLGLGGAARVPLGGLKDPVVVDPGESEYRYAADAGGVVPMAYGRYGLTDKWDLGLMVAGTTVRAEARYAHVLQEGTTRSSLIVGLAPYGGWIPDRDVSGSGGRVGFEVPFVYGIEIGGVYEIWIGARGSGEYVFGDFQVAGSERKASGAGVRAGPVIGMALGVRRVHALIELTAAYEYWFIDHAGVSLNRGGFVLIPGFGIRLRL
ncbi:MAG: hypothetical protein JRJ10_12190 [Deltaproteobacteria bacterium]|nr:hypothetical protein [Deltaproteobacteria bacterium]MBW2224844.1 hypothetical protein [Deltaproteobacteria bacterium]MBW2404120.1 hypothetical protein [Deltaproteobacteria bacterium]MBW2547828.1 hypothetical protein [Deltaproteobacteria bacterium]MBW2718112.1 hypothetical protein [Deltaproteobacteria bacterium]